MADARPIKQGLRRQPQTSHAIIDEFTTNIELSRLGPPDY